MNDRDSPAFVGRRQTDLSCKISTRLSFSPQYTNEEAGLVLRQNEKNHYDLGVTLRNGRRQAFLRRTIGGQSDEGVVFAELTSADLVLEIKTTPLAYEFSIRPDNGSPKVLGSAPTQALSSEKAGGFTGVYIGMYATGNGKASTRPADFDWFEYQPVGN
jgi:alpha-N-arabinofuranosidase